MRITEENFIDQIKKKNERALEYVIDNYAWILKTVIKKHLFRLQDFHEECMNDCLLAIWKNIHYYNPEKSSFKNWIAGIAKYKSIDYIRKYLRHTENADIEKAIIPVEDNLLREILTNEISSETEKMLHNLSKEDRIIFKKLYIEDKDMDEISKDTGLGKSVLYNRLSRGKKKIRNMVSMKDQLVKVNSFSI
ncbi:sigma-70 family RNA polymerase sigma factor [Clostridiisalibacter paucivorans]|uniref:sigma-70 family RNA polymerase sigma factor n=1 Tax=Clostridiisalibacter paucivorans TaxID=408753 RepID=UPI00047B7014|nr:sigma-70 family RNA polymerase sigma factor [Clostridiisalibacter paucivorans]